MAGRRRERPSDDGGADRWLGTYGDMVTLLMAFFVMLYAISQVDEQKFQQLVAGLAVFGNTSNLNGVLDQGSQLLEGEAQTATHTGNQVDDMSLQPHASMTITKEPEKQDQEPSSDGEGGGRPNFDEEVERVARQLEQALGRVGLPASVADVRGDPRGVIISVSSDDVLFALGSTDISPVGRRIVRAIGDVVQRYDHDVVVEGHTDNVPLRRPQYSNWNLSTDRAVAVLERLHRVHGVDQRRLVATGYGEFRPLVPNNSATNRAHNRRVDVLLHMLQE
ncbi:MAG TPA: flagellar motor protein MotB [Euzebyales bacterium]|nr:flagellar motor protein MotB [Euzebyales bacterium]